MLPDCPTYKLLDLHPAASGASPLKLKHHSQYSSGSANQPDSGSSKASRGLYLAILRIRSSLDLLRTPLKCCM
ncbi:hypothetical protein M758_8G112500 [Ceratodon purpureus]|nr:hypothetical protein M758_8G112500 [Ceratodon purpureus]